jgi:hypothetical protein
LATFGYLWLPLATFGYLWLPLSTFGYLWLPLATFGYLWLFLSTFASFGYLRLPFASGRVERLSFFRDDSEMSQATGGARASTITPDVVAISVAAREAIMDVWSDMILYPGWSQAVSSPSAVAWILRLAENVLAGLNIGDSHVDTTSPDDLVFYWRKLYSDHFLLVPPRHTPDLPALAVEVAQNIAGGVYSMYQQSRRYRKFLNHGFPSGFPVFPEYVGDAGQKTEYVNWDRIATSCSYSRSIEFQSKMAKLPRRPPSLRSTSHSVSDLQFPADFT